VLKVVELLDTHSDIATQVPPAGDGHNRSLIDRWWEGRRKRQIGGERRGVQQRGRTRKAKDSYNKHDFALSSGRVPMTTGMKPTKPEWQQTLKGVLTLLFNREY
jgi:hypothetical protein